ncbi:MAG: glycoside hydrolase family 2 TIM barrel-domain containing protein [Phycisphaerales bacterium]|nr:glycoside hydrolase family 2 TIM barrel-domain containing protein [Phycisphaerales bacterium]
MYYNNIKTKDYRCTKQHGNQNKFMGNQLFTIKRIKFIIVGIFCSLNFISFSQGSQEYNLDNDWRIARGDYLFASKQDFLDEHWSLINLPYYWQDYKPNDTGAKQYSNHSNILNTGTNELVDNNILWFRKIVYFKPHIIELESQKIYIVIDCVATNYTLYINGEKVEQKILQYGKSTTNISPFIRPNQHNLIALKVMTQVSGYPTKKYINHIKFIITNKEHFDYLKTTSYSSIENDSTAHLFINSPINNPNKKDLKINVQLEDTHHIVIFSKLYNHIQDSLFTTIFSLRRPHLWNLDTPYLYNLELSLYNNNDYSLEDKISIPIGIRTITQKPNESLRLNNQPIKLKGYILLDTKNRFNSLDNQYNAIDKVKLIKGLGFNAIQVEYGTVSNEIINACDKIGLYVLQECPNIKTINKLDRDNTYQNNTTIDLLTNIIKEEANHPSIILWRMPNEVEDKQKPLSNRQLQSNQYIINAAPSDTLIQDIYQRYNQEAVAQNKKKDDQQQSIVNLLDSNSIIIDNFINMASYQGIGLFDTIGLPTHVYYFYRCILNTQTPTIHLIPTGTRLSKIDEINNSSLTSYSNIYKNITLFNREKNNINMIPVSYESNQLNCHINKWINIPRSTEILLQLQQDSHDTKTILKYAGTNSIPSELVVACSVPPTQLTSHEFFYMQATLLDEFGEPCIFDNHTIIHFSIKGNAQATLVSFKDGYQPTRNKKRIATKAYSGKAVLLLRSGYYKNITLHIQVRTPNKYSKTLHFKNQYAKNTNIFD